MLSNIASGVKRGYTFDPECSRTTARYRATFAVLRSLGIESTVEHSSYTQAVYGIPKHVCNDKCKTVWPAEATDEVFQAAADLVSKSFAARQDARVAA